MNEARSLRDYQREASAASRGEPSAVDLGAARERRELLLEGWPEPAVDAYFRFGRRRVALLYELLDVPGGVRTPKGQGTLKQALSGWCLVELTRGGKTATTLSGRPYKPMRPFRAEEITPYAKGDV